MIFLRTGINFVGIFLKHDVITFYEQRQCTHKGAYIEVMFCNIELRNLTELFYLSGVCQLLLCTADQLIAPYKKGIKKN